MHTVKLLVSLRFTKCMPGRAQPRQEEKGQKLDVLKSAGVVSSSSHLDAAALRASQGVPCSRGLMRQPPILTESFGEMQLLASLRLKLALQKHQRHLLLLSQPARGSMPDK